MIDRIVLLNDIATPMGGATALTLRAALGFRDMGYAVTLLTGDSGVNGELGRAGVEIVGLGQARLTSSTFVDAFVGGLYNRRAYAMVADWIARNDTPRTVYHLHGWAQILSPAVFRALRPVRERLVISAHDFFLACPNGSFAFLRSGRVCPHVPMSLPCIASQCDRRNYAHKLWRVARQALQRLFYDREGSPPVLAIHESMRPFLMRAGIPSSAIRTVPNPVVPFSATRIPAERNREVLFVGRLEETKGADLAAAACRRAGATLRMVGDGALRGAIARDYPEVLLMGRQPAETIGAFASSARMLVMPSRYPEPYGLVAAEAMWSGLPVIAAETAFLSNDIVAAGAGLACEPRDEAAFAAAIRTILDDDDRCRAMSFAARDRTGHIGLTPQQWLDELILSYEARLSPGVVAAPPHRQSRESLQRASATDTEMSRGEFETEA